MMTKPKGKVNKVDKSVRASISFPANQYADLERIAQEKKVSIAWVVREAVDKYLTDPLGYVR